MVCPYKVGNCKLIHVKRITKAVPVSRNINDGASLIKVEAYDAYVRHVEC